MNERSLTRPWRSGRRGPGGATLAPILAAMIAAVTLAPTGSAQQNLSCAAAFAAPATLAPGDAESLYRLGLDALKAEHFSDADALFRSAFVRISDMSDRDRARRLEDAVMGRILETSLAQNRLSDAFFQLRRLQDMVRDGRPAPWLSELMRRADEKTVDLPEQPGAIRAVSKCRAFGIAPKVNLRILFAFDKADLTLAARETLARIAPDLQNTGAATIVIRGHTDATGAPAYNDALSLRRAQMVAKFLAASPETQKLSFKAEGAGERELLYPPGEAASAALERRVEIQFN